MHLVGILFPLINEDAGSKSHQRTHKYEYNNKNTYYTQTEARRTYKHIYNDKKWKQRNMKKYDERKSHITRSYRTCTLYGMVIMYLCKQSGRLKGVLDTKI